MNHESALQTLLCYSIQQTGTWFVLRFLEQHTHVNYFSELRYLYAKDAELRDAYDACMVSRHGGSYAPELLDKLMETIAGLLPTDSQRILLQDHMQDTERAHLHVAAFSRAARIVVPVRDPMKSLITRWRRHPDLSHRYIVDGFEFIPTLADTAQVFFFPIDLYPGFTARYALLKRCLKFFELPEQAYVEALAKAWTPQNTRGDYELKRLYQQRDLAAVSKAIPDEFEYLCSKEAVIRPFLERLGYRDLPWWS